jgi:hypothetical protein
MSATNKHIELQREKSALLKQIQDLHAFRPGSLEERFRKCGKPTCHCAHADSPGHGPIWVLTRKVKGKTVSKVIKKDAVDSTRKHIENYHRFQEFIHEYVETNVMICDALMKESEDDGQKEAEKRGSREP